ncbi:MAG: methionine adenosyltransferase [Pseudomonadaceae bacterium]|nr:methionine adenosyltransferase [Pseudomonadaceae bacterium]
MTTKLFTSEAVSCGHPDKVCDQISDAVLDAHLAQDPQARVACEVLVTTDFVCVAGEYRSAAQVDVEAVVRKAVADIGYVGGFNEGFDAATLKVQNHMHGQSAEIAQGVDSGDRDSEGAGDQGLMFGYACTDTPELMPAPIHYSHAVLRELEALRRGGETRLRPDAKSQMTVEYERGKPVRAHTLLISHQHGPELSHDELTAITTTAWQKVLPEGWMDENTRILVNPTGSFVLGGPAGDTGLTGRKIIVDTYGGYARHGGGAFSGKDPTKVDRSAAYAARYLAKNVVAAGLATQCEIQLAYAIGIAEPLALYVDTFGTAQGTTDDAIASALPKALSLTPRGLARHLGLAAPIYRATASGGHFGRAANSAGDGTFPWERVDLAAKLKDLV